MEELGTIAGRYPGVPQLPVGRRPGRKKGTPKTGGRLKGTPNHATADIMELARVHGPACIAKLFYLVQNGSQQVAVVAARELLDRGYGKPKETIRNEFAFELMAEHDLLVVIEQNLPQLQGLIAVPDSLSPELLSEVPPEEKD